MIRFKQFLLMEAPSIEDQLRSVADNRKNVLDLQKPGNLVDTTGKFPRVNTTTIVPGDADWISPQIPDSVQLVANPGAYDGKNMSIQGSYHPSDKTIAMYNTDDMSKDIDTLTHEFGHHDQHVRQGGGGSMRVRSPGIAPPNNRTHPLNYQEYAYTDLESNARTVTDADLAGREYKVKLDDAVKGLDPTKDAAKIQEIKNKLRGEVMNRNMASERAMSAANVRGVLNAKDLTPDQRASAMNKVLDAAGKAERGTQEGIARSMQAVERGEFDPTLPRTQGSSVKPATNPLTKPLPGSKIPGVGAAANIGAFASDPISTSNIAMDVAGAMGDVTTRDQTMKKAASSLNNPMYSDSEQMMGDAFLRGGGEDYAVDPTFLQVANQRAKDREEEKKRKAGPLSGTLQTMQRPD